MVSVGIKFVAIGQVGETEWRLKESKFDKSSFWTLATPPQSPISNDSQFTRSLKVAYFYVTAFSLVVRTKDHNLWYLLIRLSVSLALEQSIIVGLIFACTFAYFCLYGRTFLRFRDSGLISRGSFLFTLFYFIFYTTFSNNFWVLGILKWMFPLKINFKI